jgi:hypothetical protein
VHLVPQNGKFKFNVKHNEQASLTAFDQVGSQDSHYTVVFNPVNQSSFNNGEFSIYVYPVLTGDLSASGMSSTFLISYNIGSHHVPLLDDQPTMGFMSGKKINYYTYYWGGVDEVLLTTTKMGGNVEVLISLNQTNDYPTWDDVSEENGVYVGTGVHDPISKAKIEKFCKRESGVCAITIAVRATNTNIESQYVLTAKGINESHAPVTKVENGVPQHGTVKAGQFQYYYFKTSGTQSVTAVTVPNGGDPNIFVSLVTDLNLKDTVWTKPTEKEYLKKSTDSIGADILILTPEDLVQCKSSCILVFGVQGRRTDSAFTLTVTRGIAILRDNYAFSDSLGAWGNYRFYEYYRTCKNCTTVISVSTLTNNNFNVFVNFGKTDTVISHQDETKGDFVFRGKSGGSFSISPKDLEAKGLEDKPGYFFIEVHSHTNFNYTISVSSNAEKMHPISRGIAESFKIQGPDENIVYTYKHQSPKSFSINIHEDFGLVDVLINAVPENEEATLHIPKDQTQAQWGTFQADDRNNLEILSTDVDFCENCTYAIKIESATSSRGSIMIQEKGNQSSVNMMTSLKFGVPHAVTMQDVTFNHFKFIVPDKKPVSVQVNTLSGDVQYEITSSSQKDTDFGTDSGRSSTLVFRGTSADHKYVITDQNISDGSSMYYLTIKSVSFYSRVSITVGHAGDFSYISETVPQKVYLSGVSTMVYYIDPTPGHSKIIVEMVPRTKQEKFTVYAKMVYLFLIKFRSIIQ